VGNNANRTQILDSEAEKCVKNRLVFDIHDLYTLKEPKLTVTTGFFEVFPEKGLKQRAQVGF